MNNGIILTAGFGDYDRTRALHRGEIVVKGYHLASIALPPSELFPRAFQRAEFDISEISASTQLIALSRGTADYVALPVFLSRSFRFDAIYVHAESKIERPEDLAGRIIGIPEFQMTAAVWVRGILQDRYGVDLKSIRYRTGGLNQSGRRERIPLQLPAGWLVDPIPQNVALNQMLVDGAIDAIIAPNAPSAFEDGNGCVRRLFSDPGKEERAYFSDTGIFPVMHTLGLRRTLYERYPELADGLIAAFTEAKDHAFKELDHGLKLPAAPVSLPWLSDELQRTRAILGNDPWPYGMVSNRRAIETLCRYAWEQGLLDRPVSPDELFSASTEP